VAIVGREWSCGKGRHLRSRSWQAGIFKHVLSRLPPPQGTAAMQSINVMVLNPWFFAAFFGTAAACVILAVLAFFNWNTLGAIYPLAGSVLYRFGSVLVTMAFIVPLNQALAAVEPASAEGGALWTRYRSSRSRPSPRGGLSWRGRGPSRRAHPPGGKARRARSQVKIQSTQTTRSSR
jgi:uncharacterized membrane protein